ncbi:hypothetical protein FBZ83_11721 [Azospirillum brasilense]|uniref:Uncharacterized protein n=1 Tax=Azospirillum brasilense TaxID=192 RepID=A0A560BW93_AZOBR|nr:hypothetical protein [Azospirillum brasilense]TWA76880.1 hypothetical protein FBZ83_11721 [Azospirillum brasilense]
MAWVSASRDVIGEPIVVRFDGLDADRHEIELSALGESLKGISRVVGVAANFAATDKFVQHKDALSVRVITRAPEAKCFEVMVWVKWAAEQPLISGTLATLLATLITYIIARAARQREEMRQLRGALETAIKELGHRDQPVVDRLLTTIDKMAEALKPAVKQAVAPVGETAGRLSIGDAAGRQVAVVGPAEKQAIMADEPIEVTDEQTYHVLITELDMETGGCKVALADEPEARYAGKITDPAFSIPNNPYALAMAARQPISVKGKATIKDGAIDRLFISDTA